MTRRVLALVVALSAGGAGGAKAAPAPAVLSAQEAPVIALLVVSPPGTKPRIGTSEILQAASQELEAQAMLEAVAFDGDLSSCDGRLGCWAEAVNVATAPSTELLLVFVVRSHPTEPDSAFMMLIDLGIAQAELRAGDRTAPEWQAEAEARVAERAVRWQGPAANLAGAGQLQIFMRAQVERLEPFLDERQAWCPVGTLEIQVPRGAGTLELDERAVGLVSAGTTLLRAVRPGLRHLRVIGAGGAVGAQAVQVTAGETRQILLEVEEPLSISPTWIGAGALALGGVGVSILGLTQSNRGQICAPLAEGATCSRPGYARLVPPSERAAASDAGSGPLTLPLGMALVTAGLVTWLTDLTVSDDSAWRPWLPWAAGAAAGVLVYGLGEAVNPRSVP